MVRGSCNRGAAIVLSGLLFASGGGSLARGADAPAATASPDQRIAELEKRVAELEALLRKTLEGSSSPEVAELKRRLDLLTKELEAAKMGEAAEPRTLEPKYGLGPSASKVYGVSRGVSIGGYGEALVQDFAAETDEGERTGEQTNADMLRAVLYFGYKFNDTIVLNSEIEFEHASTGEGDEELGEVSVEFATLDFLLKEQANVRAGLVLVPVGFINEMHEPPTFLGARRPDVERLIIPATWREIGVGGFGDLGAFSWRAYVMTGLDAAGFEGSEGLREGRQNGAEAVARDLAFSARADFHGVPGLLVGASFYQGESGQGAEDAAGDVIGGQVTMYDVHAEYNFKGLQMRGLWTEVTVDDAGEINRDILGLDPLIDPTVAPEGVGETMNGWYLQAGYDVLTFAGEETKQAVIPFVRYERYDTQDEVPDGFTTTGENDVKVVTYGVSWKPILNLAIKADFQDYDRGDGSGTDQFNVAIGYLF